MDAPGSGATSRSVEGRLEADCGSALPPRYSGTQRARALTASWEFPVAAAALRISSPRATCCAFPGGSCQTLILEWLVAYVFPLSLGRFSKSFSPGRKPAEQIPILVLDRCPVLSSLFFLSHQ